MANILTLIMFVVLSSFISSTVFANDALQGKSVHGLPQRSATRALPATKLWETDEVELLQTEVVTQTFSSQGESSDDVLDGSDNAKKGHSCQDFSDSFTPNMSCFQLKDDIPKSMSSIEGMPTNEPKHDVPNDPTEKEINTAMPSSSITSSVVLNWCLDLLVLLVIVDGIRRWRHKDVAKSEKSCCGDNWQLFMQAALAGDTASCEVLLGKGIDLAKTDDWGCTVLHAAAKGGSGQIVRQLLELGSKVADLDAWEETPLHLAARSGHTDVCELLIANGAPKDAPNAENWTPLVAAAHEGRKMTCKVLLHRGAGVGGLADSDLPMLLTGFRTEKNPTNEGPQFGPGDSLLWQLDKDDRYTKLMQEDDFESAES